jgi:hypothetical protein
MTQLSGMVLSLGALMVRDGARFADDGDVGFDGSRARAFSFVGADDRCESWQALRKMGQAGHQLGPLALAWAESGFPSVRLGHQLAAALACTSSGSIDVRPPWTGFHVALPSGMFAVDHPVKKVDGDLLDLFVVHRRGLWRWMASSPLGCELNRTNITDLGGDEGLGDDPEAVGFGIDFDNRDERTTSAIGRLLAGICLSMAEGGGGTIRAIGKGHGRRGPRMRVHLLSRPVSVDCREPLAAYLSGGGSSPTVRWMVRGHWRNQACGYQLQERRSTWIEPHWKGPDNGPLSIRPHDLKRGLPDQ